MSKYNVLDLFCGCGGLSKGFEMAGFNIIGGVDFNKEAIDTFNLLAISSKFSFKDFLIFLINSPYSFTGIIYTSLFFSYT